MIRGPERATPFALAVAVSLLFHGFVGTIQAARERSGAPWDAASAPMALELVEPERAEPEPDFFETDALPPDSATPHEPAASARPRRPTTTAPQVGPAISVADGSSSVVVAEGPPPERVPVIDPRRLLPEAAARGVFGPRVDSAAERGRAMEQALNADLYRVANAVPHDTVRPPPHLEPTGDGGFRFAGHLFDASISPEGDVSFSDMPNLQFSGFPLSFSFDITTAAEQAAGNDPHNAERRWFIEETRRVRHRLVAAARARHEGRALVRMRRELRELWAAATPTAEKRRLLFRLWDDCADDEVGAGAREAIVQFIARKAPAGSAEAYTAEELVRFNRGRYSASRFAPYQD